MAREFATEPREQKKSRGEGFTHEKASTLPKKVETFEKPQKEWSLSESQHDIDVARGKIEYLLDEKSSEKEVNEAREDLLKLIKKEIGRCVTSHNNQIEDNYLHVNRLIRYAETMSSGDKDDIYDNLTREQQIKFDSLMQQGEDAEKAMALSKNIAKKSEERIKTAAEEDRTWEAMKKSAALGSKLRAETPAYKAKISSEADELEEQMKASKAVKAQGWLAKAYGKVAGLFKPAEYKVPEGPTKEEAEAKQRQELAETSLVVENKLIPMFDSLKTAEGWTEDETQDMFKEVVDKGKLADKVAERVNYANTINVSRRNPKLNERQIDEFIKSELMKAVKVQEAAAKKEKVEFIPLAKADLEYLKKIGGVGKFDNAFRGSYESLYKQIEGQVFSLLQGEEDLEGIKDSKIKDLIKEAFQGRLQPMRTELMHHMRYTNKDNVAQAFKDKFTPNFMINELREEIIKERNI